MKREIKNTNDLTGGEYYELVNMCKQYGMMENHREFLDGVIADNEPQTSYELRRIVLFLLKTLA